MRGWRATRPHPSRSAGRSGANSGRSSTAPGTLAAHVRARRRARARAAGRRPPPRSLATASTAEKDAALLAAADLCSTSAPTTPRGQPARRRGRRRRPAWTPGRSTGCASPSPHRRHGRRPARRSRRCPTRSARCSTAGAAQRAPDRAAPGAARRRRDHLREPPERHQRRRRHLPEVGQRRPAAGLGHRAALEPGDRRGAARRPHQGRAARRRGAARRRRPPRGRGRAHAAHRRRRLPHPAGRSRAHPEHPRPRHRARHHRRRRQLPRLRRRHADLDTALDIVVNAKTQRPSVCNAAESLLVHEAVADAFLPRVRDGARRARRRARRRRRRPARGCRPWARRPTTTSRASSSR